MNEHTPGPWCIASDIHSDRIGIGSESGAIVSAPHVAGQISGVWGFPNAHLIAAAPELLTACVAMLGHIESGFLIRNTKNDHETNWAFKALPFVKDLQAMDAAIRKATGNSIAPIAGQQEGQT